MTPLSLRPSIYVHGFAKVLFEISAAVASLAHKEDFALAPDAVPEFLLGLVEFEV